MTKKQRWCPTQGGTFQAYDPEYFDGEEWRSIPTEKDPKGSPVPLRHGGIISTLCLFGKAQAQALAWNYASHAAAKGIDIEVRVQSYEVVYDLKARKTDI